MLRPVYVIILLLLRSDVLRGEVLTMISGVFGAVIGGYRNIYCLRKECCTDSWIPANFKGLEETLSLKLYGQHLVTDHVVNHLKAHVKGHHGKALVLSFHGWTGTGKTFVSRIVAEKLFYNGMQSEYVHLFSAIKDFPHHEKVPLYKDKLRDTIEKAVKDCPRSFFIFDEMHKMPPGIIDTLKPYLDFYEEIDGIDYRNTTFIFLSNAGANAIAERTIKAWNDGVNRDTIKLNELEEILQSEALNSKSGMWHSELIKHNLITAYIPFLPLERRHVNQCIRDGLVERKFYTSAKDVPKSKVQEIADELQYFPENTLLFSSTGCKRVHAKLDHMNPI